MAWSLNCGCLWRCCPTRKSGKKTPNSAAQMTEKNSLITPKSPRSDYAANGSISEADLRRLHEAKAVGYVTQQPQDAKDALGKVQRRTGEMDNALGNDNNPDLDAVVGRWSKGISPILTKVRDLSTEEHPAYNTLLKWLGDILRRHPDSDLETRLALPAGMANEARRLAVSATAPARLLAS